MKIMTLLAAAGVVAAATVSVPAAAQHTVVAITTGPPAGAGWVAYHDRTWHDNWDGPRYYDHEGPHRGFYSWNNNYYQNCSYRETRHGHKRDWHCW